MLRPRLVRWIGLCAAAEFFGIAAAALWYGSVYVFFGEPASILPRVGVWVLMSMAAIPEGVILGGLQAFGVRWFVPDVSMRKWIIATIAVGLLGWAIGTFIPMFLIGDATMEVGPEPGLAATVLYAAIFGVTVGAVFGLAQSWALRAGRDATIVWFASNAIGWAAGLSFIYAAAQIASEFAAWPIIIVLWALGGVGAGGSVGIATGFALLRIARNQH